MKQIRLAFSGSGFKNPVFVGVLKAVREAGIRVVELAGTSGGSIVAALFAAGMSIERMEDMALHQDWSRMLTFDPWSGLRHGGYCSGGALLRFLQDQTRGKRFSDLDIQLKIVASDLVTEAEVEFGLLTSPDMPIALAARASASIPFIYAPVRYKDMLLVDGGCCDNIPADNLDSDDIPRVGIYLTTGIRPSMPVELIGVADRVINMMLAANEASHVLGATVTGARIIRVPADYANGLDTNMPFEIRKRLIDDGYEVMSSVVRSL